MAESKTPSRGRDRIVTGGGGQLPVPRRRPHGPRHRTTGERHGVGLERIRVIAPFRALVAEYRKVCRGRAGWTADLLEERCATVHRAQGKDADVVVLVLGGGRPGARERAAGTPHLLNVAASRAKRRLYVVGERSLWATLPHFNVLAAEPAEFDHHRARAAWAPDGE
ncbi:AAA domain-containing protein [Streptomyces parvus]|uniref:AAA domain-containing protein n=1 Tax=Streptomyces parvus TaxID=66428 RepID=UPI0036400F99